MSNPRSLLLRRIALLPSNERGSLIGPYTDWQRTNEVRYLMFFVVVRHVYILLEHIAHLRRRGNQSSNFLGERIIGFGVFAQLHPAQLQTAEFHNERCRRAQYTGEIVRGINQSLLSLVFQPQHGMLGERLQVLNIVLMASVVVQRGISQKDAPQSIRQSSPH